MKEYEGRFRIRTPDSWEATEKWQTNIKCPISPANTSCKNYF